MSGKGEQEVKFKILFTFSTTVTVTTITLHYYSSSFQGLPSLRFHAVPDEFNIWNAPIAGYSNVVVAAVPPGKKPAGHKSVSIK